jgi:hypothetical protein
MECSLEISLKNENAALEHAKMHKEAQGCPWHCLHCGVLIHSSTMLGVHKASCSPSLPPEYAFRFLGELHVPGKKRVDQTLQIAYSPLNLPYTGRGLESSIQISVTEAGLVDLKILLALAYPLYERTRE